MSKLTQLLLLTLLFTSACAKKKAETSGETATVTPEVSASIERGQLVYKQYCIACHMADGLGAPPMNPPLAGTSFVRGEKNNLISVVLRGMNDATIDGQKFKNIMPPLDFLTDDQVADVLTYVRNSFGNKETAVLPADVASVRRN